MYYTLRYRGGKNFGGILDVWIELRKSTGDPDKDLALAERIGRAYVNQTPGRTFVFVKPGVVADESILEPPKPPQPDSGDEPGPAPMPGGVLNEASARAAQPAKGGRVGS